VDTHASVLGLAKPALADLIVADSVAQFSGTQGQGGWYYGYNTAPFSSNTFTLMTQFLPSIFGPGNAWYVDRTDYWAALTDVGAHPNGMITSGGRLPVELWAVRRWVSTVDGPLTISGNLAKINTNPAGPGVVGHIFVDGTEVYSQYVRSNDGIGFDFLLAADVHVGSTVDFALAPFASDDRAGYSRFTAQMESVPEPGTVTLLSCALLGLVGCYSGRRMLATWARHEAGRVE
jgi:hypothetical protein